MIKILYFILKILAKAIIKKYQPQVIGITGSVGKTSAKEAIFTILNKKWRARRNLKNYNNEIGLPLTILGRYSGGANIFKWFFIFIHALKLLIITNKKYPEILILEMAADRPGDIDYLTSIVKPTIVVITALGPSHLEHFGSLENIIKEKSSILKPLTKNNWAVFNQDDEEVVKLIPQFPGQVKTYGSDELSSVQIENIELIAKDGRYGTSFQLTHQQQTEFFFLPLALGKQHASAIAAATAVGLILGLSLSEISQQAKHYQSALGRTNLLPGIKNSWVIDDSYNASPQSAKIALDILTKLPAERRIAVLGDMLELGSLTEQAHQDLGKLVAELKVDYLLVVGERARDIARGAKAVGMTEDKIFHFPFTEEAGLFLQNRLKEGDVILVKGSRGAKMEQVVYEIMAKPWEAPELLVGPVR